MLPDGDRLLSLRLMFDTGRLFTDIYGFEMTKGKRSSTGALRNTST